MENALVGEGLTQQRAQEILGASVPVGGIIPYCLGISNLPPNWRACDGSIVTNAQQGPFIGKAVPDLRGQFLFGATSNATVGTKGGTNSTYSGITVRNNGAHGHTVLGHSHSLNRVTGSISRENPDLVDFVAVCDGSDTRSLARLLGDCGNGGSWGHEGQHMHNLGGATGNASPGTSIDGNPGEHGHTVNDFQAKFPPYTEVLYIVRIY